MKALIAAVRAALEGDSVLESLAPGGIHSGRAPAGASMPYLVVTYGGASAGAYDTAGKSVRTARMRFETYSPAAAGAAETAERVVEVLEPSPPVLEAGACLAARKLGDSLALEPGPGPAGGDVWRGAVEMEFLVEQPVA